MSKVRDLHQSLTTCHDCGARPGQYHQLGCDVERCPRCGGQLLQCLMCGCVESDPDEPWPPPLDDREVWTGEWPGKQECREFGWYVKEAPGEQASVPCRTDDLEPREDLNRLRKESEWDRQEKRYVQTTLTEALAEMGRRGILWSRGWELDRRREIAALTSRAAQALGRGEEVLGYAFYTCQGKWRRNRGKDFALYFGQVNHPEMGPIGLPDVEVGRAVADCLAEHGVRSKWDGDPARPIRVLTGSIRRLAPPP
jgi:hypothetical protein